MTTLLKAGADLEARNELRRTPLHVAAVWGNADAVKVLLKAGADLEARAKGGFTPLYVATGESGNTDTVTALLDAGANLEARSVIGRTPLHAAARSGNADTVTALLDAGANLEARSVIGRTPLHAAARSGNADTVSKQLFGILPKIKEVDDWIKATRNRTFREGHPELSFHAAAGRPMKHNKKKAEGRDERLAARTGFIDGTMVREWLDRTRGSGAARDDILDALALCRSAARLALGCHGTLPAAPP